LGRLVLNHSTNIEGLIPILQKLALNINIKTITPAVISRVRGRSSKLIIRLSVKTINGYKAIARKGKTAQEVFISTDLSKDELKKIIDNLLLINLFTVIFFAIFFIFAIIMQFNGIFIFINFIQIVWNPLVVPLITILIIGALVNGINSWWRRKLLAQEEDI